MAYSRVSYTAGTDQVLYNIPFPFLTLSSLEVRINNVLKTLGEHYSIQADTARILLVEPAVPGSAIYIRRRTPRNVDERLVVFQDPSNLSAETLNQSDLQLLYIIQEILDDVAEGVGVGTPQGGGAGVTIPENVQDALDALNADFASQHSQLAMELSNEVAARTIAVLAEHEAWVAALLTEAGERGAAILEERTLREEEDSALASQIEVVSASVSNPDTGLDAAHSRITAEETARASEDEALASDISTLQAVVDDPTNGVPQLAARIATVESTYVDYSSFTALSTSVSALEADVANGNANLSTRIADEETARAAFDYAIGLRASALESQVQTPTTGALARISVIESTYATQSFAESKKTEAISAAAADATAKVNTEASARASAIGGLSARWGVNVDVNGRIVGHIQLDGSNASSSFLVQSDRFQVVTPGLSPITLVDARAAGLVFGADILSDNYSEGASGWRIRRNGDAEFSNVVIRDAITTYTVAAPSVSPAGQLFTSSITVTASAESGATIRYSTGGAVTEASPAFPGGGLTFYSTTTLRVRAFKTVLGKVRASEEVTLYYLLNAVTEKVATPSIGWNPYVPDGVTISCGTSGASIYYRRNGGGWSGYGGAFTVSPGDFIEAYAAKSGFTDSDISQFYVPY